MVKTGCQLKILISFATRFFDLQMIFYFRWFFVYFPIFSHQKGHQDVVLCNFQVKTQIICLIITCGSKYNFWNSLTTALGTVTITTMTTVVLKGNHHKLSYIIINYSHLQHMDLRPILPPALREFFWSKNLSLVRKR